MYDTKSPKKSLGQHFLMHRQTAERIVLAAGIGPEDTVLEIGPGRGLLTRELLAKAKRVVAVEADHELIPQLQSLFASDIGEGRLELIESDIRSYDPNSILGTYHLVANIPYYITGEIFRQFLTATHKPASITVLIQKEVAERIARSIKEGLLSLSIKAFGVPKYAFTVPKGAFVPAPSVDSAVLTITSIHSQFASSAEEESFFKVIHAGFAHKRKQLGKNLSEIVDAVVIKDFFISHDLPMAIRAEDVPLHTWLALAKQISS